MIPGIFARPHAAQTVTSPWQPAPLAAAEPVTDHVVLGGCPPLDASEETKLRNTLAASLAVGLAVAAALLPSPPAQAGERATALSLVRGRRATRARRGHLVMAHGFPMTGDTAERFNRLVALVNERFPGRRVRVTSTTGGVHSDPRHAQGRAVDFVVEALTARESVTLEALARRVGFQPVNEYLRRSRHWTGPHMHVAH
ncbi:MAG: hypothetical protein FJX76_14585 [Armatimonadetes bacterium]|nr:hypothetical protein [Armatimonadota bacterium]